ncbi:MAG: hypothetical protein U1E77_14040 [Inhella sp.]
MKLLRLLVLLLVSLAVPAYGWAGLRPTAPCPMEMAPQAAMQADVHEAHEAHCPPDMDCCGDPLAAHCQAGQDCHPATVLAPQSDSAWPAPVPQRGVVALACQGNAGPPAAPPLRPPRAA